MPEHVVTITPFRQRHWDSELHTTVVRTHGYRAVCSCGERSRVKRKRRELRGWARAHHAHVAAD
jgi:hypothetical protein